MIVAQRIIEAERHPRNSTRLVHVERAARSVTDRTIDELPALLEAGDVLVVNDAATLPASLFGRTSSGEPLELRLCGQQPRGRWRAVLFGSGDWRTRTEDRLPPPTLRPGGRIFIGVDLAAVVESVSTVSPRLVELRFDREGDALWAALYRHGRPVQYAHETAPLALARMQTPYATRPWAAEMPSAGRPLRLELLEQMTHRGIRIARLTHAAGLSSTGDVALDALLPLPEWYDIPHATAAAIRIAHDGGHRVIAIGTSTVRALEGCAQTHDGEVVAGSAETDLVITHRHNARVVDGLLSGVHAPDSSHFALLTAFLPPPLDARYSEHVLAGRYRGHEFGDSTLVL